MWSANSYQPFADLMLNDLQFGCSYLPTRWPQIDISQRYGIFSAELPAVLVLLYPGCRKVAGCNVTAAVCSAVSVIIHNG